MLIQTVVLAAVIFALAAAALSGGVLTARLALLARAAHYADVALLDASGNLTAELQTYVASHGSAGPWPSSHASPSLSVCTAPATGVQCTWSSSYAWKITGSSSSAAGPGTAGPDLASHLQNLLGEQRLSALLTVTVRSRAGAMIASRTRMLTYRVFQAPPYAVVTGVRDATSLAGTLEAAEGDDSGVPADTTSGADLASPDPEQPDRYRDSVIKVSMTCRTVGPAHNADPLNANLPAGDDGLPWGVGGRAFEAPCSPSYAIHDVPVGAPSPVDGAYVLAPPTASERWFNRNEDPSEVSEP